MSDRVIAKVAKGGKQLLTNYIAVRSEFGINGGGRIRPMLHPVLLGVILVLAAIGVPVARKFIYGLFHGANVFVFVEIDGKTLIYRNPREVIGLEDPPLEVPPAELLSSDRYETYYNVCWFDSGTLIRCKHSYHRKPQNALYCDQIKAEGSFIAKVMEER